MRFSSLEAWLQWQEQAHPVGIALGLERAAQVFAALQPQPADIPVITVAGTNGKGSSVAMLEAIYQAAGYRTASYTSPHLLRYNERIHLDGMPVSDSLICEAFARIDSARQQRQPEISLTYFEFGTLAALDIFYRERPDVILLEVGLGGRLDAVNIVDADVALITSIGLDHMDWLGSNRESIGREKAGIMRKGKPAIFSGNAMPDSIADCAAACGAHLHVRDRDFVIEQDHEGNAWHWRYQDKTRTALPLPALRGDHQLNNAAGVIMAIESLADRLPVNQRQLKAGLLAVNLPGRFQIMPVAACPDVSHILDVAHNADSMAQLAGMLQQHSCSGRTFVVLGMMQDKDHVATLQPLLPLVDHWQLCDLPLERAMTAAALQSLLQQQTASPVASSPDPKVALQQVQQQAQSGDRIVICGSFVTVEFILRSGI